MDKEIVRGSANVFADMGLPDADIHFLKAQIVGRIYSIAQDRGLTQAQTGKIIGLKQPDVSNLLRGRFKGYSLERLLEFLNAFDQDVEIVVKQKPERSTAARTTVHVAA